MKPNKAQSPLLKASRWMAIILAVAVWLYSMHNIFAKNNHLVQLFESDLISAAVFSVFWFGLIGLGVALENADFSRNEDGKVTGDSEITW